VTSDEKDALIGFLARGWGKEKEIEKEGEGKMRSEKSDFCVVRSANKGPS